MKTIQFKTFLGKITPLPWKMHGTGSIVPSDYNSDGAYLYCRETSRLDMNYIIHCCNHFPELVEAIRVIADDCEELSRVDVVDKAESRAWKSIESRIRKALASAETVQIEE